MIKILLIISASFMIFAPSFSYAQSADQATTNQVISGSVSASGSSAEDSERKASQGVIDFFAKTVTKSVAQQTVEKFSNAGLGLNVLMAVFVLFAFALIVRDSGLGSGAIKPIIELVVATLIIGSCINTTMYTTSGMSSFFSPTEGSTGYLDVDFILWSKEKMDGVAQAMWGAGARDEFEAARVEVFEALVTGETDESRAEKAAAAPAKEMSAMDSFQFIANGLQSLMVDPFSVILKFAFKFLDILYVCALFLCTVLFSLYLGVSIMFFKLIVVFGILPQYRSRVTQSFKIPAAFSLFQLTNLTMISILLVLYKGLSGALVAMDVSTRAVVALPLLAFAVVMVAVQIAMVFFIPKISRQILNLSLEELTNLSGTILKAVAGMGMSAAAFLPVAGGVINGLKNAAGAAANSAGYGARDFINGRRNAQGMSSLQGPMAAPNYPNPYGRGGGSDDSGGGLGGGGIPSSTPSSVEDSVPKSSKIDGSVMANLAGASGSILKKKQNPAGASAFNDSSASVEGSNASAIPQAEEQWDSEEPATSEAKPSEPVSEDSSDSTTDAGSSSATGRSGSILKKNRKPETDDDRLIREESERQERAKNAKAESEKKEYADYLRAKEAQQAQRAVDNEARRKLREERKARLQAQQATPIGRLKSSVLPSEKTMRRLQYKAGVVGHALTSKQFLKTAAKVAVMGTTAAAYSTMKAFATDGGIDNVANDMLGFGKDLSEMTNRDSAQYAESKSGLGFVHQSLFAKTPDKSVSTSLEAVDSGEKLK